MFNFITLKCNYCNSVIANLPETVIDKLEGLTFECECCNHSNMLKGSKFQKCPEKNATSIFSLINESLSA